MLVPHINLQETLVPAITPAATCFRAALICRVYRPDVVVTCSISGVVGNQRQRRRVIITRRWIRFDKVAAAERISFMVALPGLDMRAWEGMRHMHAHKNSRTLDKTHAPTRKHTQKPIAAPTNLFALSPTLCVAHTERHNL